MASRHRRPWSSSMWKYLLLLHLASSTHFTMRPISDLYFPQSLGICTSILPVNFSMSYLPVFQRLKSNSEVSLVIVKSKFTKENASVKRLFYTFFFKMTFGTLRIWDLKVFIVTFWLRWQNLQLTFNSSHVTAHQWLLVLNCFCSKLTSHSSGVTAPYSYYPFLLTKNMQ